MYLAISENRTILDDSLIEARGTAFSDDEHDDAEDFRIYSTQRAMLPHHFTSQLFPTLVSSDDIPAWMVAKDSSALESKSMHFTHEVFLDDLEILELTNLVKLLT